MMNFLALALIASSIAAASFFSPPPDHDHQLIREGHRIIIVEFERQVPQSSSFEPSAGEIAGEAKAKPNPEFANTKKKSFQLEESSTDDVKSLAEKIRHKAAQLEESVSDAVKFAAEEAKQKAAGVEESGIIAFKTAAENAKQKAVQFHESAGKAVKSAAETASTASKDVARNFSTSAAKTADMAVAATRDIRRNLSDILQRAWELGRDAAVFVGAVAADTARSAAAVIHLLGFATAYGTCVWVTFASNHLLASAIPRQQFGIVQSRLYPVYFRFLALAVAVGLAGHVLRGQERMQGYNLMVMLAIVLVNLVWLEPKVTKAMFERMKLEKEEGRGRDLADVATEPAMPDGFTTRKEAPKGRVSELQKRLKILNNYSSFLNTLTLMGLSWHLVDLA